MCRNLVLLASILMSAGTWAVEEEVAIREVIQQQLMFTKIPGDTKLDPGIYTGDVYMMWPNGETHRGQNDVVSAFEKYRKQLAKDFTTFEFKAEDLQIRVNGDFAWATTRILMNATTQEKKQPVSDRSWSTFVLNKKDGKWRIAHEHNSPLPPA